MKWFTERGRLMPRSGFRDVIVITAARTAEARGSDEWTLGPTPREPERRSLEGRRADRARWAPTGPEGCAHLILWKQAHRNRRTLHRGEGSSRRLLDDPGELEGGGNRMGQALPRPGRRRDRGSTGV